MASTSTPYGFRAVNELGGLPYAGSTRQFLIDPAGYGYNIYNGNVVYVNSSGYLANVTTTGADVTSNCFPAGSSSVSGAIGIFVGCSYVNAQGQVIYSQYYPANTTGVVTAYVIDDNRAVFQVQAYGSITQAELGQNVYLNTVQSNSTGSTTTGNSTISVNATAQTAAAAFRVVGFVNSTTSQVGDNFTDILVKFNPSFHAYSVDLGL